MTSEYEIYAEFTLGFRHRPALPLTHVLEPVELDESLMPGATVAGRFRNGRPGSVIWVPRGVPQPARLYPDLLGFEAHVFLTPGAAEFDAEEALERVYRAAVLACLEHESFGDTNWRTGIACLRRLAQKGALSEEERSFQLALERLELFGLRCRVSDERHSVSLVELRRCPRIYLVSDVNEWAYLETVRASGAICLSHHRTVESLLDLLGLPWEGDGALEDAALGNARIVNSKLREKALRARFSSGMWSGERLAFPVDGNQLLVFDFGSKKVRGPSPSGEVLEIPFDDLVHANVDERELMGENKVHRWFFLHLSNGEADLIYNEHMREYYEYSRALRDMEAQQDLATSVIHAVPAALGMEPRLARPDLVSKKSLFELTGRR